MRRFTANLTLGALLVAHCAIAAAVEIDAGPIWNDGDARGKCPAVCARSGNQAWTGEWRTTVPNVMSVCSCADSPGGLPVYTSGPVYTSPVVRYENTDFVFNDVERTSAGSFDNCATQCLADNRCVAFTYSQAGSCYKKSGVGTIQNNSFATSGFIVSRGAPPALPGASATAAATYPAGAVAPGSVKMFPGTDFPGNDLGPASIRASSPDDCASLCMGDGRCGAFTYNIPANKCYLKAGPTTYEGSLTAVSGVIPSRPAPPPGYGGGAPVYGPQAPVMTGPVFCSIAGTPKCPGCSVSCGPGQRPVCEFGVEGVTSTCARNSSCTCQ